MSHETHEVYEGAALAQRILLIMLVVIFSGSCSGMTVGLFALDASHLKVKARSGTAWQQSSAKRVLFFVERAHWSLVTLLVSNALAMTTLPLLLDVLVSPTVAIVLSVTAVLFFGEVIPQALFVRHGFTVISWLTPLLFILLVATSPFSYPCAKLLDYVIGHQAMAGRDEIERHVRIAEGFGSGDEDGEDGEGGSLLPEEIHVMRGALSISKKTLKDIKGVSVDDAFMLPASSDISQEVVDKIVREGKSRVPVYLSGRSHIIGVLLTKTLLSFAYQFHVDNASFTSAGSSGKLPKIGELPLREPFRVQIDAKVSDLLNSFKNGRQSTHLACIYNKAGTLVKFVTLDDVFQVLGGGGGSRQEDADDNNNRAAALAGNAMGEAPSGKTSTSLNNGRDALVASAFNAIRESTIGSSNT